MNAEYEYEVDFEAQKNADDARGLKYGSFIEDLEESVANGDSAQIAADLAAIRRYHESVCAARRELNH